MGSISGQYSLAVFVGSTVGSVSSGVLLVGTQSTITGGQMSSQCYSVGSVLTDPTSEKNRPTIFKNVKAFNIKQVFLKPEIWFSAS